jgi:hypothetical protein
MTVAVIRAWIDGDPPRDLRIRVVKVAERASDSGDMGVTSDIGVACAIVRGWLESFADAGGRSRHRT